MIESLSEGNADLRKSRTRRAGYSENTIMHRMVPNSPDAERGLLGCVLLDAQLCAPQVSEMFQDPEEACYDLRNGLILRLMLMMQDNGEPVDVITIVERLRSQNRLDEVGGVAYIAALPDATGSAGMVSYFMDIVQEKMLLRQMIHANEAAINSIYNNDGGGLEHLFDTIEKNVLGVRAKMQTKSYVKMGTLVKGAINRIEECHQNQGKLLGLSTGLIGLDEMTNGMRGGKFWVFAGLPGDGKSALALNIAEHVAIDLKQPVGIFTLEMPNDELTERSLCTQATVNMMKVSRGFLAERDFPRLTAAASKLSKAPIYLDDSSGITIGQLKAKMRRMWQAQGIKLFVIDYLQLLIATNGNGRQIDNRQQEVAAISRGVKELSKELNVPIIGLSQVDKNLEKENRKPRLGDLRESAAIGQDADLVAILQKRPMEDDQEEGDVVPTNLVITKQRGGPKGTVYLQFLKTYTKFEMAAKIDHSDVPNNLPYND